MKPRNYKREYQRYQSKTRQKKRRALRNKARRKYIRKYGKAKLRGKDVDHRDRRSLSMGSTRLVSIHENRSFRRKRRK